MLLSLRLVIFFYLILHFFRNPIRNVKVNNRHIIAPSDGKLVVLEEVFENKEQIEVSKFYERLPKPHALAVQEWLDGKIHHRKTSDES